MTKCVFIFAPDVELINNVKIGRAEAEVGTSVLAKPSFCHLASKNGPSVTCV